MKNVYKEEKSKFSFKLINIFLKVSIADFRILAHLINWKRQGVGLKDRVKNENLHLCKLEFYLCVRNGPGKYQIVSTASYSSIIEEGNIIRIKKRCFSRFIIH